MSWETRKFGNLNRKIQDKERHKIVVIANVKNPPKLVPDKHQLVAQFPVFELNTHEPVLVIVIYSFSFFKDRATLACGVPDYHKLVPHLFT